MGDFFFDRVFDLIRAPFFGPNVEPQDTEPVGPVDEECADVEREYQASYFWRGSQRFALEEKWLECRARSEGWAKEESDQAPKTRSFLFDLLSSEGSGRYVGIGLATFCPWLFPLAEIQSTLRPDLVKDLGVSFDGFVESWRTLGHQAAENRKKFEKEIEDAIRNPTLGDLSKGDLFVLDEEGLNDLVTELLSKGGKQKVRNVKVKIDGDQLKISGEYDHWSGWYNFTALAEFELKNGKSSGFIKKIEALGMDLTDDVKNDILTQFRNFDIELPEGADIKDLSWVQIPGIKRIEIRRDQVVLEREPKPGGPS